jgi:antitoxin component of MazEF toxin-antitoxin module
MRLERDGDDLVMPLPDELVGRSNIELGDDLEVVSIKDGELELRLVKQALK